MTVGAQRTPGHPLRELLRRYGEVFRAAWARRDELAGPRRMADEYAFLPAAISLQETPPHPAPRRVAAALCALFSIGVLWSCFGRVDVVAAAQGRVIVSERSKTIQPLETSVVKSIRVKDGDPVKAGQLLVELDGTDSTADSARISEELSAAHSEAARSQALMRALETGHAPQLDSQRLARLGAADRAAIASQLRSEWGDIGAKLSKFAAEAARRKAEISTATEQLSKYKTTLPLARQREKDLLTLTEQGFISTHAGQDRTRERIELERDLATARARLQEVSAASFETDQAQVSYRAETYRALVERETQAGLKARQLAEETAKADRRGSLTRLTAPVSGTVQQLAIHTAGGVVTPAQVLMVVVPDDGEVTAEVILDNKDIGFVRPHQETTVKLETFPYTRYGTIKAHVQSITADAVQDEKRGAVFPVTLRLDESSIEVDGRRVRLVAGMNMTAEIKTGNRRVIDYLIAPLRRHLGESLQER